MKENSRTQIVAVRLTPEEKEKLMDMCADRDITVSYLIRELIGKEMEKNSKLYGF